MPEGPEMYRMAQQIRAAVAAQPLTEVWFARADLQQHAAMLQAQTLRHVSTVGKALLLEFSNGACVYTHNQLYGRWLFSKPHTRSEHRHALGAAVQRLSRSHAPAWECLGRKRSHAGAWERVDEMKEHFHPPSRAGCAEHRGQPE